MLALSLYTPVYLEDFAFNKDYYLSKNKDACLKMEIIPKLQLKKPEDLNILSLTKHSQ